MLTLYEPNYEDLWFRQMMLADEDTMSYNHAWGGTIPWPEDKWSGWYDHWITCHEGKRYYRYLKNEDGQFVGEIAYHRDAETQHEIANVMIYSKYRKKAMGTRRWLCCVPSRKTTGSPFSMMISPLTTQLPRSF